MTTDTGPIYGVPLIDTLPLSEGGMLQQMPSRRDLVWCQDAMAYRVAAGYEVLLAHYHRVCEERDSLERTVITQEAVRRAAEKEADRHADHVKQLLLACKVGLSSLRHGGIVGRSPETDVMEDAIRNVEQ